MRVTVERGVEGENAAAVKIFSPTIHSELERISVIKMPHTPYSRELI